MECWPEYRRTWELIGRGPHLYIFLIQLYSTLYQRFRPLRASYMYPLSAPATCTISASPAPGKHNKSSTGNSNLDRIGHLSERALPVAFSAKHVVP